MCRVGKVHKAAPATKSALQGPQSTAPATKSPLQGPQVLHLPPNLHFKVTKYCTCYEICTSRPTKYCTRHDMCTSQGPRSTAPATTCALQGPQNIAPAKKLALPGLHLLRNLHFKVHKVYGACLEIHASGPQSTLCLPPNLHFKVHKYFTCHQKVLHLHEICLKLCTSRPAKLCACHEICISRSTKPWRSTYLLRM